MDIILASQSPRRKELLGQMGLRGFKVTSPNVDEDVDGNLPPAQMVEELSQRKARAVADSILTLPMVLPPTVAGFFLLLQFTVFRELIDDHGDDDQ